MRASFGFLGLGYTSLSNPHKLLFFRGFSSKLFVKGISFSTTEETLAKEFSQFGEVIKANIVMNKTRNISKGFGYVTFANEDDARNALGRAWPSRCFKDRRPGSREPPEPVDN